MLTTIVTKRNSVIHNLFLITLLFSPSILHTKTKSTKNTHVTKNKNYQECVCDFCMEIQSTGSVKTYKVNENSTKAVSLKPAKLNKHKRTIMIYMAADNDLRPFAARNIQQMALVGSNQNVTVVVHLDIRISDNKKITRRYIIEKDQVLHVDPYNPSTQQMDSGNPATLISFCEWAIKEYVADEYDLILWNHGTGVLEPANGKIINPMDLFTFNPATHRLDLDRTIGFMDAIRNIPPHQRGVCWDDSTGNYLSNRKLSLALQTICQKCLDGKKFGLIGFDACLMSMLEIGSAIKKYARVMVGSQEVELGMGWKYDAVLYPFVKEQLDTVTFARHIVTAYNKTYDTITNDYTLSAVDLDYITLLETNVDYIAKLLIEGLTKQKIVMSRIIKESRNKLLCTHFDEPTYIDLHHFFKNLSNNLRKTGTELDQQLKNVLLNKLDEGVNLIEQLVFANTSGRNLKNARGLSIYFPERGIHKSYQEAEFLVSNAWGSFLTRHIFG